MGNQNLCANSYPFSKMIVTLMGEIAFLGLEPYFDRLSKQ